MNRLFAFAALLLITSVASAGTITTTFDENTPGGAPAGLIVFDINIENTDNWVGTELTFVADGAGVHQEKAFGGNVDVNGIAPVSYGFDLQQVLDTYFMYPGAVQQATLETLPAFMPAPFDVPSSTGNIQVGWFDAGNELVGSYKIGQLALDVPEGAWTIAPVPNGQVIGELVVTSRVKEGESITREVQTLLVTEVPEPTSMVLILFGAFGLLGLRRRK